MNIVGVLLAAGNSTRFGRDKLVSPLEDGEKIGVRSARKLITELGSCIAVVRETDTILGDNLKTLGFDLVIQTKPEAGMGNSLALGVAATGQVDGWLITLADMPWIAPTTLSAVVAAVEGGAAIAAPVYNGQRGHPVGFGKQFRRSLECLDGDYGAKGLIKTHSRLLQTVRVDDPGILCDVDRPQDLQRDGDKV